MKKVSIKVIVLILLLILIETVLYFLAKLTPFNPWVLISNFDDKLPLISNFIYIYVIWYLLLLLIPYMIYFFDKKMFNEYVGSYLIAIFIAFITFFFIPTTIIRPEIVIEDLSSLLLSFIYQNDTPALNCLPSMHCVLCFMFIYYTLSLKKLKLPYKIFICILSILIIISTLLIKQHVIWDVIGALLVTILSIVSCKLFKISDRINKFMENYI